MKPFILAIIIMITTTAAAQHGQATTEKKTFSRATTITELIHADASTVWNLLVDSENFPKWNSTIISIEGEIREGQKIKLKSSLDPSRTFKLKIKEATQNKRLIWGDIMGQRTYTLENMDGGTQFTMHEKIGGPMFPLFAGKIPSFDASFEQFSKDLKKAAEAKSIKN